MATLLDEILPRYDVNEVHRAVVDAPRDVSYAAVRELEPREVRLLIPLMELRMLPARLARRAPDLRRSGPLIEEFVRNGFTILGEDPGNEIVVGAIGKFWRVVGAESTFRRVAGPDEFAAFAEPGYAKAATNFVIEEAARGCRVTTETRIAGTDATATRTFGRYWSVISPGSAAIRRSWLNGIVRRASR